MIPPCPACGSTRTLDQDPSDDDAEEFRWCEPCATASFPSEEDAALPSTTRPDSPVAP